MNAVVLMATPCPKTLHGKGEKWIARNILHMKMGQMAGNLEKREKTSLLPSLEAA